VIRYPVAVFTASTPAGYAVHATANEVGPGIAEFTATVPSFEYLLAETSRVQRPEVWLEREGGEARRALTYSTGSTLEGLPDFTVAWAGFRPWPTANPFACAGYLGAGYELRGRYWGADRAELARYLLIGTGEALSGEVSRSKAGVILTLNGTIAGERAEGKPVDYRLGVASGKQRSAVIREIAALAGIGSVAVVAPGTVNAPIDIAESTWWETCAGLAALSGQRLYWRRDGALATCPKRITYGDPVLMTIGEHLAESTLKVDFPSRVVTEIRATGSAVLTGPCETITEATTQDVYAFRPPLKATAVIETDGSLTDIAAPEAAALILDRRIETFRETRCGTEISVYVREWGWKLIETWRFTLDDGGTDPPGPVTRDSYHADRFIFAESPDMTGAGNEPAYLYPRERWVIISETWTVHQFDGEGWKIGSTTYAKGWRWPETAIKTATVSEQDWPSVNLVPGLPVAGDGRGIGDIGQSETYTPGAANPTLGGPFLVISTSVLSHEVTTHTVVDGYITQTTVERFGYRRPSGNLALFSDGSTSLYDQSEYGIIDREVTFYEAVGEASHRKTVLKTDFSRVEYGEPSPTAPMTVDVMGGYLPTAERLVEKDHDAAASSQPLEVIVRAAFLEDCWPRRTVTKSYPLAETQNQLRELALADLADGAAFVVSGEMPALFPLAAGDVVFVDAPDIGVQSRVRLWSVQHSTGPGEAEARTSIEGRFSPGFDAP
jgi:hypothetical protein